MNVTFRISSDGQAHACPSGWITALCGAQCTTPVSTGEPCERCMELATERLTAEATVITDADRAAAAEAFAASGQDSAEAWAALNDSTAKARAKLAAMGIDPEATR